MKDKKIVIPTDEEVEELTGQAKGQAGEADGRGRTPSEAGGEQAEGAQPPRSEAEEYKDKYLRAVAELSNYRKRCEKDREESLKYAPTSLIRALLPVLDNLQRVVASAAEHPENTSAITDGVKLTLDSFRKVLKDNSVSGIEAQGQPFNPAYHEAMMQQPSEQYEVPTVLQVVQEGFTLYDRVLRPARVIVSKPAE